MLLLDEIFSSELRSRVALADVFLKLECLVQSKDDLEKSDHIKFHRREQVESENEQQRRGKGEPGQYVSYVVTWPYVRPFRGWHCSSTLSTAPT